MRLVFFAVGLPTLGYSGHSAEYINMIKTGIDESWVETYIQKAR